MASIVDEIAIKLGVQAGDLKAALADSDASIKKFAEGGVGHVTGLTGAIHETHSAVRQLHRFFVAGGIVEVVKGFFEMAIKGAEGMKEGTSENAAAVLRFKSDIEALHGGVSTFAVNVVGFFNRVGESIGSGVRLAKEFWAAQITGNQANLAAFDQAEKSDRDAAEAEERLARLKKEHGAELKQLATEINAEEKKRTEELLKQKPLDEQLKDIIADIAKQRAIIQNSEATALDRQKARLAAAKDENELVRVNIELRKKQADAQIKAHHDREEAELKGLTTAQKISSLTDLIKIAETNIAILKKEGVDTTVLQAQLDDRRSLLAKVLGEEEAKSLERKKKIAGSSAEELEFLKLQHKVTLGLATGPEELRLKQIKLQRQERELELQLDDLAEKAITGKLTPADEKRLETLGKQKTKLDQSLIQLQAMMDLPPTVAPPIAATLEGVEKLNDELAKFQGSVMNSGDVQNLNDTQLGNLVATLQDKILTMQQQDWKNKGQFDLTNGESVETAAYKANLANALKEQSLRYGFRRDASTLGSNYVQTNYAPQDYQRLLQYLNPDQQKQQAQNIATITNTLTNLFPLQAKGIRSGT